MDETVFEFFLVAPPGLEGALAEEARAAGFHAPRAVPGGVETRGGWPEIWRANLELRGAVRVLVRIAAFRALHLAQLDKRARKVNWAAALRPDRPVRVEVTCRKSRIYHDRAARQRIEGAIAAAIGAPIDPSAGVAVKARIEDDLCTISLDSSGPALHQRGHKEWVGKAPMRETLAAPFLRAMGFDGSQAVVDPMCGSGTFVLEAADIASGLSPGRSRRFAFEDLAGFDAAAWADMKAVSPPRQAPPAPRFFGFDRDDGAIRGAAGNADRAGVARWCTFRRQPLADLQPPDSAPGIVIVNPPYGARIGNRKALFGLYGSLGAVLRDRFGGWTIGLVTSDGGLAKATGIDWTRAVGPVDLGGLKVTLRMAAL